MGLLNWLARKTTGPTQTFSGPASTPLGPLLYALAGGGAAPRVGREEALSVPAVLRGRNLMASIATLPLVQYGPGNERVPNPMLEQIDPDIPNVVMLAQTVEDLVFEAEAWWEVTKWTYDGFPANATRHDPCTVRLQPPSGRTPAPLPSGDDPRGASVWIDGREVSWRNVIRFDSPNPGVLKVGGRAIKRAIALDKAARLYADDPRPLDYFTPAPDMGEPEPEDVQTFLNQWVQARREGATAYVPGDFVYHTVDTPSPKELQLVELQERAALDIANSFGLDPEELGVSTTSRTYANVVDRRKDKVNDVLAPYMRAITDRLSMGDVTKRGYRVAFDLDDYMKSNPTERWSVYEKAKNMGVLDVDEIRRMEGLAARMPADPDAEPATVDADSPAVHQFDASKLTFVDLPVEEFSVNKETRVIEGLVMPYGRSAKGFRFERGSLTWSDVSRVKLLRDHDFRQPLGVATNLTDTDRGLKARFKVARGPEGDRALELAEDGVLDGLSVGVDFDLSADATPDQKRKGEYVVRRADLREVSLTPMPAFDDARVTKVAASMDEGTRMTDDANSGQSPEAGAATDTPAPAVTLSAEQFAALTQRLAPAPQDAEEREERPVVNPTRLTASTSVREALPYRFDRGGNFVTTEHVFSADLHEMARARDESGIHTDAGRRVMALIRAQFDVDSADINEVTPAIQRPDMYVDQRDYRTPLWNFVNRGAPPNGVQPFVFPKYSSSSGLVGDHTEGTEPTSGTFVTTNQTVTPTALSGKASITREVWDMGGNPAVSTLIWNQMVRGWREGLETATATFLNTLTAATDINLGTAVVDDALADAWDAALADLQFVRGYDFEAFAMEKVLYKAFVAAEDSTGRRLYPIIGPTNANGTARSRFTTLDLGGVTGVPSWALASTAGSPNNSWLFDPTTVHGWATAPQRLEFPGTDASGDYAPVAMVDIAIWGYKAFANSDIGGVRQVIYDSVA